MVRATYLIASASNEEKWSSVTNGRTLILIVSHEIYLSDTRVHFIFEILAQRPAYNCICDSKRLFAHLNGIRGAT